MVGHDSFSIHEIFYRLMNLGLVSSIDEGLSWGENYYQKVKDLLNSLDENIVILRSKKDEYDRQEEEFKNLLTPAMRAIWE